MVSSFQLEIKRFKRFGRKEGKKNLKFSAEVNRRDTRTEGIVFFM